MFAQIQTKWLEGANHSRVLWLYLVIVVVHWLEHLCQMYQIYVLGWMPKAAGGVLGLWWPWLVSSELLHVGYNALLWGGLLLLRPGFQGHSRGWWNAALGLQSFHFFEHVLLLGQWLLGMYLFGAAEPISIGQLWVRRPELHFMYNLVVFVPTAIAVWYYWQDGRPGRGQRRASRHQMSSDQALSAA
jgi:hypothetical protein